VDPLAGSYYVEYLTDTLEQEARALIEAIDAEGGAAAAIEAGYFQKAIAESAWAQQQAQERGDLVVVGVNRFTDASAPPELTLPDFSALAQQQIERLDRIRASRDSAAVRRHLEALRTAAASPDATLMPTILECVRVRATIGEMSDVLREVWGVYGGRGV
jgi:methylmalonyl-CoA mutase N-terminal domain/subunit